MKNSFPALLIAVMIGAAALGYGLYQWMGPEPDGEPADRETAARESGQLTETLPSFSLPDPDGQERHIDEWEGDILVINFWGTWCAPCREEVPLLIELQEEYADRDVTVLGIALDEPEPVNRFAEDFGINYPLMVGENETLEVLEAFGSATLGMPHTFIVNREGEVVNFHLGLIEPEDVEPMMAPAFAEESDS
ncbi:thiol-disulfide isomerase/thioredoxin [Natronospira proteinivora]|uniref:Thiol-disulfide isomerase/thioredoxin n=1 Tax=Natronospira proteinivora TaxID=1807133 RepID=A0ABT1GBC0_9GAMM|nr:TlpA disulfide reductase family protein [Natronospira proteinivora]MCP1728610.1 thiol-disulfide isomerase/thioredoxin [Natronospira proteinivora]